MQNKPDNSINSARKKLGNFGEAIAGDYLAEKNYKIITRNYRCRYGEIDIIAEKDGVLVFVEVKTRTNKSFGPVISQISQKKINRIYKTAEYYIGKFLKTDKDCRIDLIILFTDGVNFENYQIKHIENIFTA